MSFDPKDNPSSVLHLAAAMTALPPCRGCQQAPDLFDR